MKKSLFNIITDLITYFFFLLFMQLMRILGMIKARRFCCWLFKILGPLLPTNKIIRNNLTYVYGKLSEKKIKVLQARIWENFAKYVGEFPFIDPQYKKQNINLVEFEGLENIKDLINQNQPFIIFSGHFANWDFVLASLEKIIPSMSVVYRKINNKFIDEYVRKKRSTTGVQLIRKGSEGIKDLIRSIKDKKNLVMLVDQKMNDGIKVPFMGKPAMTSQAIAVLSRQYNYPIVPGRILRKEDGSYKIIFSKSFSAHKTEDKDRDVYNVMRVVNDLLSSWVYEAPEQWFWMHQRWGKPHEMLDKKF